MTLRKLLPYSIACLLTALPVLSSCVDGGMADVSLPHEEADGSGVYVSVVVNTEGGRGMTKAYDEPKPGEEGDGEQAGTTDENVVRDVNVFFFQGDEGINTTGNPEIVCSLYFQRNQLFQEALSGNYDAIWYTLPKKVDTEILQFDETYNVLTIVNAGSALHFANLNALRDYPVSNSLTGGNTNFLMASESDAQVTIVPSSQNDPIKVSVDVERMVARVDCAWQEDGYDITGDDMPSGDGENRYGNDRVKILGAALVNRYVGDTYAFKRVTVSTTDRTANYLGDELPSPSAATAAGNYVLDPLTLTGKSNASFDYYYPEYFHWDTSSDFHDVYTDESFSSTHNNQTYYRLDYARENINTVRQLRIDGVDHYATGIMYKAQYIPDGYREGETFYVYPVRSYNNRYVRTVFSADELRRAYPDLFGDLDESLWVDQVTDLEKYTNGECYYTYWIRHADDADRDDNNEDGEYNISAMEYAIVRNNIYQLYVNSIEGLGSPSPDSHIEEFTTEIHLHVKPWNQVEVEVPAFD